MLVNFLCRYIITFMLCDEDEAGYFGNERHLRQFGVLFFEQCNTEVVIVPGENLYLSFTHKLSM